MLYNKFLAGSVSPEEYENSIPGCCTYTTYDQHISMLMMCWGLEKAVMEDRVLDCGSCPIKRQSKDI